MDTYQAKQSIKRAILRVGRPVWKRLSPKFYARIDRRIDLRLPQTDAGWRQHAPAFLNAVSTVQAFGHELARSTKQQREETAQVRESLQEKIDQLEGRLLLLQQQVDPAHEQRVLAGNQHEEMIRLRALVADAHVNAAKALDRIEFIRREVMFEMKYGRASALNESTHTDARILNPGKVAAAQNAGVRLNLGSGHIPLAGYVNVDMRELPDVDIVADVGNLPFEDGSLAEVFSAHLLEHFPQEELTRRLLPYWHDLLAPGGSLRAVAPDGEAMLANLGEGSYSFDDFREVLFGVQEYERDFHYNLLTPSSLTQLLEGAGFHDIEIPARGRRNGKCFEFEVTAIR